MLNLYDNVRIMEYVQEKVPLNYVITSRDVRYIYSKMECTTT
jgi:hypothetical protein